MYAACAQLSGTVPLAASFSDSKKRLEASEGSRSCQPGTGTRKSGTRSDAGKPGASLPLPLRRAGGWAASPRRVRASLGLPISGAGGVGHASSRDARAI